MISRRLLRIKALMALYAFNRRDDSDLVRAESELTFSITKTYDLYHYLLLLVLEINDIASEKIEQALQKKIPTPEDLNPNRKFADNPVIIQIRGNLSFNKYLSSSKLSWVNFTHIPRSLYNKMLNWDVYSEYMASEDNSYTSHRKFVIRLITELFYDSEDLENCLEEQSIYWNDDIDYVIVMVEKTLKKFKAESGDKIQLMTLFKNKEDEDFVKLLFRKAIINTKQCSELIDNNTTNWEVERIALMDILVMQLAITEVIEFPEIPVKVTLNEYIEIAKYYCTPKSSTFVNGILDNIVKEIREKGLFRKYGRGLVGETVI
ncbi:MAG TPA: transcription antitermination factor NusB [Bacteroidales bacterium]|jgi:N utilization substance protein B|nr:transcription antitermination factor NusB [Bacteroidales bacterium]HOX75873.1 transcription antitermination factor NusB [Bacteroidales bacterium]HPM87734.1 transcription antitermination factor NusB [Bacteroidales bacterium]HQM70608.1 transcription antitermination factor NusB [Bacteroidales bacterium]